MTDRKQSGGRWCILRTAGRSTLPLADSLNAAGLEAWTPRQTLRRPVPGSKPGKSGRRPTHDIDAPILPTFVFAAECDLVTLASEQANPASQHPGFSIMQSAGRAALVANAGVAGLAEAERAATQLIADLRAADTREAQRQIRAAAMKTERARRRALREETRHFADGSAVSVIDDPAFIGRTGIVQSNDGHDAVVAFGGFLTMKIEAWRLLPDAVKPPRP